VDTQNAPWALPEETACIKRHPHLHPADFDLEYEWHEPNRDGFTMVHARVCAMHLSGYLLHAIDPDSVATVEMYLL